MRPDLPALTSLRFFAALIVVIFHYDRKLELFSYGLAHFGYEAVAFFFILSGFILTYVHAELPSKIHRLNVDTRTFMAARLARIVPAYLLALMISAPFFFSGAIRSQFVPPSIMVAALLVPLMAQAWFPPAALLWNGPAWSLSNELFFYLLYPAIWSSTRRVSGYFLFLVAYCAIVVVEIVRANLADGSVTMENFNAYFPIMNLPQFVLGIGLASIFLSKPKWSPFVHELLLGCGLAITILLIAFKEDTPLPGSTAILSLAFMLMIFGAAGAKGLLSRLLSNPALVFLGEASYALYILHVPIWMWWYRLNHVYFGYHTRPAVDFALYIFTLMCAVSIVYIYVERPARAWMRRELIGK
jgi:peptidoglycan/LPS O-acetylase OafA/YrhL